MENIVPCVGLGHSNPATATVGTITTLMVITVTDTTSTASQVMHVPTSYVLERRKPEPHGFISNWSRIPISGCRQ
jgi:sugar (pentulose or hexulose) kinase